MNWKEKINRLDEFEIFFKAYLDDEIIKSIQYISLRKKNYGGHMILVGIVNMDYKEKIETYAPRILKEIREYQEISDDQWEKHKLPKRLEVFEFNFEKAKEKKELKRQEKEKKKEWYDNPKRFLKETDLLNQYIREEQIIIYDGLIIPIDHSEIIFRDMPAKCRIYMGEFDFEIAYKSGKIYKFLKDKNNYYRFSTTYKDGLQIHLSDNIGVCHIMEKHEHLYETTKNTYLKHKCKILKTEGLHK